MYKSKIKEILDGGEKINPSFSKSLVLFTTEIFMILLCDFLSCSYITMCLRRQLLSISMSDITNSCILCIPLILVNFFVHVLCYSLKKPNVHLRFPLGLSRPHKCHSLWQSGHPRQYLYHQIYSRVMKTNLMIISIAFATDCFLVLAA